MKWLKNNWLKLVAIIMALGAMSTTFPFVYYQLMNWVVVGAALVVVWQASRERKSFLVWLFALVAVVFNPIAPLYLAQDVWRMADITVAALFVISLLFVRPEREEKE